MTLHLLGTGAAVSDPHRTTTMLAVEEAGRLVLVDCGGDAVQRLLALGIDPTGLHAVILTHEHPDHVSGFPLLIEKLWLLGRRAPIPVYGPAPTLRIVEQGFDLFSTEKWDGLPERAWHDVPMEPGALVFSDEVFHVTAAPVDHPVPTIGLRFEGASGSILGYSCDTAKCANVVRLARGADVLVHEATGSQPGVHASAEEAAETAAEAGAGRLILVHLPPGVSDDTLTEARHRFSLTEIGEELGSYPLSVPASPPVGP
ncbi:MAG: ribonuclease Z [Rubricoccaceae bacterium]|nr:ribonuclease Z [Rubricoccaceae bacterium]